MKATSSSRRTSTTCATSGCASPATAPAATTSAGSTAGFRTALGTRLTLTDDDSVTLERRVRIPLLRAHADDRVRQLRRQRDLRARRPRQHRPQRGPAAHGTAAIAPFLADLDPEHWPGRVFGNAAADQYTVTWCGVRGFESSRTTNAQLTLLPDGTIEMKFGEVTLPEAIVGLSPGRTGEFVPIDISASGPTARRRRRRWRAVRRTVPARHRGSRAQVLPVPPRHLRPAGDLD